jgi:hypothetical protein
MDFVETVNQLRRQIERLQGEPRAPSGNELLRILDGIVVALEMQLPH